MGLQVRGADRGFGLAVDERAALGRRHQVFERRARQPRRHARLLVHVLARARLERHLLHDLAEDVRHGYAHGPAALGPRLLPGDRHAGLDLARVVRQDLGVDAVFERRDDGAAVRVVLGVGREHHQHVDGDAHVEAADLDVLLLHDVEQAHLDARLQVRQLVDGEDAAVRARDDAEVDHLLVGVGQLLRRRLDGVDVADQVRDGGVRRRQLLAVARRAVQPRDRRLVARLGDAVARELGDRRERVVVDLGALDLGHVLVEQVRELAHQAALRLSAQAEQDEVVAAQERVLHLGHDRLVVAEHAGEDVAAGLDGGDQVGAHLVLDGARRVAALAQRAERGDGRRGGLGGFGHSDGSDRWRPCTRRRARRSASERCGGHDGETAAARAHRADGGSWGKSRVQERIRLSAPRRRSHTSLTYENGTPRRGGGAL